MTEAEIAMCITQALSNLYKDDFGLIRVEAEEESISAHLTNYLKPYFKTWNVDIEYNRDGQVTKKNSGGDSIFPDIIIHRRTPDRGERNSPENNLVAIEVKGHWNRKNRRIDELKLIDMKKRYGYQYLFRIELEPEQGRLISIRE